MVEKYYGFTLNQLIGFILLIAVVGLAVIFLVPINSQGQTLLEIFTAPDIVIPPLPAPQELTTTVTEEGEMIVDEPTSAFCRLYPTFAQCR